MTKKHALVVTIGAAILLISSAAAAVLINQRPVVPSISQTTKMSALPPAVAEERELIAGELRARPQLVQMLRSSELRRTVRASDGTRLTVFATGDAVVIQYGPHKYATVDYP